MFDPNGDLIPDSHRHEPAEGETCGLCKRKVPHARKETSPTSKTFSYRVPLDEAEAHADTLAVVERYVGTSEQPFAQFKMLALALALVLQDEKLRGFASRAAA